jgi:DNA-binding beta-propeller fold protein YncE
MRPQLKLTILLLIIYAIIILTGSCTHEPFVISKGYPKDVEHIITNKCAVSGCHNNSSYIAAGGLNLETWEDMFKGSRTGAVVIPYRSDFSTMCYYTNTDSSLGLALQPTMPAGNSPLSKDEYLLLKNWIDAGAPDDKGLIKFSDNPGRKKLYITNRQCDVVTVIDAETLLPMRYITTAEKKFPYCVKVAPDKKYWYLSYFAPANIIQRFDATNDAPAGEINLGEGVWTSFAITNDSRHAYFVDNGAPGKMAYVDLEHMQLLATYTFGGNFQFPVGVVINEALHKLYVGTTYGNFIYTIDISDPMQPVISQKTIDGSIIAENNPSVDPVEFLLIQGTNKCYIACATSKEIKVMDMAQDAVIQSIPLSASPAYMSYSAKTKKIFVTCPDDLSSFPGNRGSVHIIDELTNAISVINSGYQPYGVVVDDERNIAAVVNANISVEGPGSHHSSKCGEKNGNITFIDLNTLNLIKGTKRELSVFPYGIATR